VKIFLAIVLSFALLAPGLSKLSYLVYFHINQNAIAKAHCVNKDMPELKCDGKCHLKTQLSLLEKEVPQEPSSLPTTMFQIELSVFFYFLINQITFKFKESTRSIIYSGSFFFQPVIIEIFSPPKFSH
jgi:hypothetical protein